MRWRFTAALRSRNKNCSRQVRGHIHHRAAHVKNAVHAQNQRDRASWHIHLNENQANQRQRTAWHSSYSGGREDAQHEHDQLLPESQLDAERLELAPLPAPPPAFARLLNERWDRSAGYYDELDPLPREENDAACPGGDGQGARKPKGRDLNLLHA